MYGCKTTVWWYFCLFSPAINYMFYYSMASFVKGDPDYFFHSSFPRSPSAKTAASLRGVNIEYHGGWNVLMHSSYILRRTYLRSGLKQILAYQCYASAMFAACVRCLECFSNYMVTWLTYQNTIACYYYISVRNTLFRARFRDCFPFMLLTYLHKNVWRNDSSRLSQKNKVSVCSSK